MHHKNSTQLPSTLFLLFSAFTLFPSIAYAACGYMQYVICYVIYLMWGDTGTAIAVLGIAAVSAAAMLGKGSWGMALTVSAGISIMFGAGQIAQILGVANSNTCNC
jgi:type IV secretory pathway VirB2 component (pilin)